MSTTKKLEKDESGKCIDITMYRGMIGSLLYLTASRPDIMFSVCLCARFQVCPKESHLHAVKRIFKYLHGTLNLGIWYPRNVDPRLLGYSDADYAGCLLDRKSTSGTCQFLGHSLISWSSKKQVSVALSTAEVEYIAAGCYRAQIFWIKSKHIDIRHRFIRDHVQKGDVVVKFMDTTNQFADIFTKPLNEEHMNFISRAWYA
ncbi:secreted RxLR effector protein 161-like [Mercurialis annua]|uniref:secreted RxLR effector protein 161-like n=1 Tax=Mercurialis annua TaxID=3986 RepID=UPI00215FD0F1|nr:secreted RxLR effector protein 161-like [Mercurialis annua]